MNGASSIVSRHGLRTQNSELRGHAAIKEFIAQPKTNVHIKHLHDFGGTAINVTHGEAQFTEIATNKTGTFIQRHECTHSPDQLMSIDRCAGLSRHSLCRTKQTLNVRSVYHLTKLPM
jgi:hypothetical protein